MMRTMLTGIRGLFGGYLFALTLRLLIDPTTIAAWAAAGLGDVGRFGLAGAELIGAVCFTFEKSLLPGAILLFTSFGVASLLHLHAHERPWRFIIYSALTVALMLSPRRLERFESKPT